MTAPPVELADPFDLPDWLGTDDVTWRADTGVLAGALIVGRLTSASGGADCDLLAVDLAYPEPVVDQQTRRAAHQAWEHGEVCLLLREERLTLALPGTSFTADRVLVALERLARAVGADPTHFAASLRVGGLSPREGRSRG